MYNHVFLYEEYGKLMENDPFAAFLDYYQKSDLLTRDEKQSLHEALHGMPMSAYLINENLFDTLKSGYQKAMDAAKEIPAVAKEAFGKVVDAAKNAADFVKMITGKLGDSIKNVLDTVMSKMKSLLQKDTKFTSAVKELAKLDKDSVIKDVKTMGEVSAFYKDKFVGALTKSAESAATKAMTEEAPAEGQGQPAKAQAEAVAEALINEAGNIVGTVVHFIEKYPPFSWLAEVAKLGEKGANALIKGLSSVTQKLGGAGVRPARARGGGRARAGIQHKGTRQVRDTRRRRHGCVPADTHSREIRGVRCHRDSRGNTRRRTARPRHTFARPRFAARRAAARRRGAGYGIVSLLFNACALHQNHTRFSIYKIKGR